MDTAYHHGHIIPSYHASYTTITSTTSSLKVKLQWLALLLPTAAVFCLYICLRVRRTRRNTKRQYYSGYSSSNNNNNESSTSIISTTIDNEWATPSDYHNHDSTRTYTTYSNNHYINTSWFMETLSALSTGSHHNYIWRSSKPSFTSSKKTSTKTTKNTSTSISRNRMFNTSTILRRYCTATTFTTTIK
ncbi:hypothetical protein BDC45DRAFT_516230 [Circinella umbellata]|nr:hypothetical protein BDC45DRAFT_516230 [Circinella umbellata]